MKKRLYAILMALLLSTVTLAGCGDSGSSRSSRDRYEDDDDDDDRRSSRNDDDDNDDDDDRSSSKSSSSSKKRDYQNDVDAFYEMCEYLDDVINNAYDFDDLADGINNAVKKLKVTTSEAKKVKSGMQDIVKIYKDAAKYVNREDYDKLDDLEDELEDILEDLEDDMYDFLDAAYDKGVDEEDLDELADYFEDVVLN